MMAKPLNPRGLTRFARPVLAGGIILAMLLYALLGPTGLFAWNDYRRAAAAKTILLAELTQREAVLKNRKDLLDARRADPDLADELVRKSLGVAHPNDVIVPLETDSAR